MANLRGNARPHLSPTEFQRYLDRRSKFSAFTPEISRNEDLIAQSTKPVLTSFSYEFGSFSYIHHPGDSVKDQVSFMTSLSRHLGAGVSYDEANYTYSPRDGKAIHKEA